ncbi:MAG: hypothetical protein KKF89_03585 [Nanoarchaeota archaeon]|nr:hypothetical protein [Nanoarchaeota archaeon]MBU1854777.1 hypothetical protein [Nanoarchaeota archaeon]
MFKLFKSDHQVPEENTIWSEEYKELFELAFGKNNLVGLGGEYVYFDDLCILKKGEYLFIRSLLPKKVALLKNNVVLWRKNIDSTSYDLASDGSFVVMWDFKLHCIYIKYANGSEKKIDFPCGGGLCSISPNNKFFVATTYSPENGIYFFDKEGSLIWKILNKKVGGIDLLCDKIIIYDKIHKETRKKLFSINLTGDII